MDEDVYERLSRIHVDLIQLCQWLNEKWDFDSASRLIPIAAQKKGTRTLCFLVTQRLQLLPAFYDRSDANHEIHSLG